MPSRPNFLTESGFESGVDCSTPSEKSTCSDLSDSTMVICEKFSHSLCLFSDDLLLPFFPAAPLLRVNFLTAACRACSCARATRWRSLSSRRRMIRSSMEFNHSMYSISLSNSKEGTFVWWNKSSDLAVKLLLLDLCSARVSSPCINPQSSEHRLRLVTCSA